MLKEMLKIIRADGYISNAALAKKLDVAEDVAADGIEQLVRMGYLIKDKNEDMCRSNCGACPYVSSCTDKIVQTYRISEKGMSVAAD